ncbi:MAG: Rrf2 family transcriptional regulator [Elusimicrobia bacterium]|nr:Rrf2 family transcriptional regulator [Elusimicrobiota bacterium]
MEQVPDGHQDDDVIVRGHARFLLVGSEVTLPSFLFTGWLGGYLGYALMALNTQFSIAVHVMAGRGAPSGMLADSVNACPSFVRRVMAKLSKADLVKTTMGKGGSCALARDPRKITLLDIYKAVEAPKAFAIHDHPAQPSCRISCGIKPELEKVLDRTQKSLEAGLRRTTLAEFIAGIPH